MAGKNMFGGGNAKSLYVPLSEIEQESISRLIEQGDLRVNIVGWGYVTRPVITHGDARVQIRFRMDFDRPAAPQPVHYFDLELRTGAGRLIFKERQSTLYNGQPISVMAGMTLDLVWDIMIQHIDPKLVRELVPDAHGLTSRLQDKDTGAVTLFGNMKLSAHARRVLAAMRRGESSARSSTIARADHATKKSEGKK